MRSVRPSAGRSSACAICSPWSVRCGSTRSNALAQRRHRLGEPAGRDHQRRLFARPLALIRAHDPVDRVGGAEHHAGANALLRPRADHARRDRELRRRQLRRAPRERLRRRQHAGRDHAAEEDAVGRDAVERRRGAQVDDDRIAREEAARGERVDDPIGARRSAARRRRA